MVNESSSALTELYLAEDGDDFTVNLLRGDALAPGEILNLGVPCEFYDALLVDDHEVDCLLTGLNLCLDDATWFITNTTCQFEVD